MGQDSLLRWGGPALRWSLVLIFLWFGFMKFTAYEAKGIAPLVMHSPLLSWAYNLLGERGFATALGIVEISIGVLIALRPFSARASSLGSVRGDRHVRHDSDVHPDDARRLAGGLWLPVPVGADRPVPDQGRGAARRVDLDRGRGVPGGPHDDGLSAFLLRRFWELPQAKTCNSRSADG